MSVYNEFGYESRKDYLKSLADDYGVQFQDVLALAQLYGASEDFDGLVTALEDLADDYE